MTHFPIRQALRAGANMLATGCAHVSDRIPVPRASVYAMSSSTMARFILVLRRMDLKNEKYLHGWLHCFFDYSIC